MIKTKMVIHGHWVYDHDTGWKLTVHPVATSIPSSGEYGFGSIVLAKESNLTETPHPLVGVNKLIAAPVNTIKSMSLYNLGQFYDEEMVEEIELYVVCPTANIKDGITHPVITQEGYMYVEDLGIGDNPEEDEPLDIAIHDALLRLEAPHQFTCE